MFPNIRLIYNQVWMILFRIAKKTRGP
jgi:hypothetical protein